MSRKTVYRRRRKLARKNVSIASTHATRLNNLTTAACCWSHSARTTSQLYHSFFRSLHLNQSGNSTFPWRQGFPSAISPEEKKRGSRCNACTPQITVLLSGKVAARLTCPPKPVCVVGRSQVRITPLRANTVATHN